MKRVHILMHQALFTELAHNQTTILGAYSNATKAKQAYKDIIEEYKGKPTFVQGYEELSSYYRVELKKSIHYFYIKVKELQ